MVVISWGVPLQKVKCYNLFMPDVEFESENLQQPMYYAPGAVEKPSVFITLAKKFGAKDDHQANMILFGVAIAFFIVSIVIVILQFREGGGSAPTVAPSQIPGAISPNSSGGFGF